MYFVENFHKNGEAVIKTLKFNLGRLKTICFKAGSELFKSET